MIKINQEADVCKVLVAIASEIKKPMRYFIPKYYIMDRAGMKRQRFFDTIGKIFGKTTSLESRTAFLIVQTDNFKEFLKKEYNEIYKIVVSGNG